MLTLEKTSEERKQAAQAAARQQQPPGKSLRKSREYRARSQDWPDVPDIAKIEEQNPEILAQKILEKGRMIEASKMSATKTPLFNNNTNNTKPPSQAKSPAKSGPVSSSQAKRPKVSQSSTPGQKLQEAPRIANFEDRLKSIITSVLNEDQHNRSKGQAGAQPAQRPAEGYAFPAQGGAKEEEKKFGKYARCETIVRPSPSEELARNFGHQQEGLASMIESYRDRDVGRPQQSLRQVIYCFSFWRYVISYETFEK